MTTLAQAFGDLHQHVRSVPDDREPGMSAEDAAALTTARQAWDEKLQDHIAPARPAIGVIRDRKVRHRLDEAREETLPEPNRPFGQARESLAAKNDEWGPSRRPRRRTGADGAPRGQATARNRPDRRRIPTLTMGRSR
ncbi:hypothetical protein PV396_06875 [Streptomyces sp. ME02-8801-2C]|uniref:hypothetical protein n=1 Tax=Streptomyces sp. ME02-8801-2C TaxID=3028680 RepID=UPI0029BF80C0|nr:hypothetical protein [Streptomyces sp. ME02-8801-2C]MDX3451681.1 hypothetical protein [Streptomyces sp. ME02-8801-2C]